MMLSRALLLALCCAYATSLTPLSAAGDDNDCALYLSGPGRTSAYDYSLNLLKGNFGYEGQHTCITYDAVNQAYLEARNRIVVAQPKGDWKAEDFASVGELLLDISINLARIYGLTYEEIEKGLPLIDTSRTLIREVCPPIFSHVECRAGKYRRFDGLCTNLQHPTWGATMAPFQRLIGPLFSDGINAPRISHTGRDLPLSRVVSRTMHPDEGFHDHAGTVMVIAWGQFMDHDYTLTGTPLDPINRNDPEECCKRPQHLKHPYCNEIRVPDDDYFYRLFGVKCIDFVRGFPSPRPGCRLGSRVPFNTLTGVLDGNTVYGVTEKFARKLRTGFGGLLRMNPVFKDYGLKDLLPLKLDIPDEGCTRPNKNMYCFEAGEIRVNEQLVLTVMHTLMAREHNRVARGLAEVNPHWDDETLFQEARRINIAEIQHITYNEFLPILLGKDVMEKFGLVLQKEGYWDGYDPDVNTDVIDAFAAAAYRFGHSLLPTAVERWSKAHKFIASKRLSDLIRRPYDLYRAGVLDEYVMGLMNQVAQAMDDSITQEVTNHLFKKVGARFGMDLVSFNMQRGREFGLPGYMEFRKFCGLSGADSFQDLFGTMSNDTVQKYQTIFEHPIDVDLWSGGVSERPLPGSMLGPTFACVIATQFSYSRRGDRFWYELPNQPSSFTPEQLVEVKKARLARVICDNTDIIDTVQLYPMVLPDHELNPRVPCRSGIIPSIDFTKWAEPAPFHGAAKQFITEAYVTTDNNKIQDTNVTTLPTQDFDCIETTVSSNIPQLDSHIKLNLTIAINTSPKMLSNRTAEDCADSVDIKTDGKTNNLTQNFIKPNDTVLKYVYKKNDDINLIQKLQGHPKNRLTRRKRSISNQNITEDIKAHESQITPLIVNYETSHDLHNTRTEPLENHETGNIIKNSNLADFNIETLHENADTPLLNSDNTKKDPKQEFVKNNHLPLNQKDSDESIERNPKDTRNQFIENDDSSEIDRYKNFERRPHTIEKFKSNKKSEESEEDDTQNDDRYRKKDSYEDKSKSEESEENSQKDGRYIKKDSYEDKSKSEESEEDSQKGGKYEKKDSYEDKSKNQESNEEDSQRDGKYRTKDTYDDNSKQYNKNSYENKNEHYKGSENSNERKYFKKSNDRNENQSSHESEEQNSSRDNHSPYISGSEDSNESKKKIYPNSDKLSDTKSYLRNDDNDEKYSSRSNEKESNERKDKDYLEKEDIYNNNESQTEKNRQNFENSSEKKLNLNRYTDETSVENSNESERKLLNPTIDYKNYDPIYVQNKSTLPIIQDVDLNDFSYERIQINNKGQIEPTKDIHEYNDDSNISKEVSQSTTFKPESLESNEKYSDTGLSSESKEENKQPIRINDGEIKPVVEITVENNSESSEAESIKDTEDKSLETFLGIKENSDHSQNEKIVTQNEKELEIGDVKQQFERIPLNYKHDENNVSENNENNLHETTTITNNEDKTQNEGTLDTLSATDPQYDKHLNFKFDEIAIKLPEIKLPDDILAYPYDESPYGIGAQNSKQKKTQENAKARFYDYDDDEDRDENVSEKKKNQDVDDYGYHGYYGKSKENDEYKKERNEEEEEDDDYVDLYEKFVRERFGKKGSFEKRSQKLKDATQIPENTKLYQTVHDVLKKTQDVQKQAERSGDPNAGYMWTLEYGQNL